MRHEETLIFCGRCPLIVVFAVTHGLLLEKNLKQAAVSTAGHPSTQAHNNNNPKEFDGTSQFNGPFFRSTG